MSLTTRERRLVAIGVLALLLAFTWLVIIAPIISGFAARSVEREAMKATLQRDQRLLRAFPSLRAQQRLLATNAGDYTFLTEDGNAVREAMEARVTRDISAVGGTLHGVRSLPASPETVRLRADAALTLPALVGLLQTLRDQRPYAVIDGLSVARGEAATGQPPGVLEVRIEVISTYAAPSR